MPDPSPVSSFMADPGAVADWREVLLSDAAAASGLLDALPATPDGAATSIGARPRAVRVTLEALATFGLVEHRGGAYHAVMAFDDEERAALAHHANVIRRWANDLGAALAPSAHAVDPVHGPEGAAGPEASNGGHGDRQAGAGRIPGNDGGASLPPSVFMPALARRAREAAPWLAERVLARAPGARRALDLGGGHGEHARALAERGLEVVLQDRGPVTDWLAGSGHLDGTSVEVVEGDFLEGLAEGPFDVVLAAGVVHIYPGPALERLFGRIAEALSPGGVLAISTTLRGRNPVAPVFAVQMLLAGDGDTHAEEELHGWLAGAGFGDLDLEDIPDRPQTLLTARRGG